MPKKAAEKKSTALAVINDFAIAEYDAGDFWETMAENFGDEKLSPHDLERIKAPSGGGTQWLVPSLDDDDGEYQKEIEGVIVNQRKTRVFWAKDMDSGEKGPPDCRSLDGNNGAGDNGSGEGDHACEGCPQNEYGSALKGEGKRCKEQRELYILRMDNVLPVLVALPPTSIKPFTRYTVKLTGAGVKLSAVTTRIALEKTANKAGTDYARAVFNVGTRLDPDARKQIKDYAEGFKAMIAGMSPAAAVHSDVADAAE